MLGCMYVCMVRMSYPVVLGFAVMDIRGWGKGWGKGKSNKMGEVR